MVKLFALRESELPDPMRWMQTAEPDCDEETQQKESEAAEDDDAQKRRGRGRKSKKVQKSKAQNDMAPVMAEDDHPQDSTKVVIDPPAPVQEESRAYDSGTSCPQAAMAPLLALCLALLYARPH